MRVLGIDEAGRGCVLGSLVIGAYLFEGSDVGDLSKAGAADSKTLSPKRRTAARIQLDRLGTADVRQVTPQQIDAGNLNTLEEEVIAELVMRWRPDVVRVDALGHPSAIPRVIERLQARIGDGLRPQWVMEPKADSRYPTVGAASIFAKTTRDALLDDAKATYGDLGSGYPSDPKTRAWIIAWARSGEPWPPIVRTRWQTIADLSQQALFGAPSSDVS
jgi:ribonuclease HII